MENLKFRLKVRKFKCCACDVITLSEKTFPMLRMYCCPNCLEPMEYMDEITIMQEDEYLISIEKDYGQLINEHAELVHFKDVATKHLTEEQLLKIEDEIENVPDTDF